jgi:hypothetical protein
VGQVEAPVEQAGLAEHHVLGPAHEFFLNPGNALKPDEFHFARVVAQVGHEPFPPRGTDGFDVADDALDLDVGQLGADVGDAVKAGAVFVAEGVVLDQIAEGEDAELLVEQGSPGGAHPFEKFDLRLEVRAHRARSGFGCPFHSSVWSRCRISACMYWITGASESFLVAVLK